MGFINSSVVNESSQHIRHAFYDSRPYNSMDLLVAFLVTWKPNFAASPLIWLSILLVKFLYYPFTSEDKLMYYLP